LPPDGGSFAPWSLDVLRFRGSHLPSNRLDRADRRCAPIAGFSLSARMTLENGGNHSLHARNRANIPASRYGSGDLERMEHAKLANGSGHKLPIGHSPSSARKKAAREKAESPRSLRKEMDSKSKSDK